MKNGIQNGTQRWRCKVKMHSDDAKRNPYRRGYLTWRGIHNSLKLRMDQKKSLIKELEAQIAEEIANGVGESQIT